MNFADDPYTRNNENHNDHTKNVSCEGLLPFKKTEKTWLTVEIIFDIIWLILFGVFGFVIDKRCNGDMGAVAIGENISDPEETNIVDGKVFLDYSHYILIMIGISLFLRAFLLMCNLFFMFEIKVKNALYSLAIFSVASLIMLMLTMLIWGLIIMSRYTIAHGCKAVYYTEIMFLIYLTVQVGLRICGPFNSYCCSWCSKLGDYSPI